MTNNNEKSTVEMTPEELAQEELILTKGLTLSDRDREDYEKMRMVQLARREELRKDRYIVTLELFLKDTLDRFCDEKMGSNEQANNFYSEYYGLLYQDGLLLIDGMQKYKEG